jgi:hypothetical protein
MLATIARRCQIAHEYDDVGSTVNPADSVGVTIKKQQ